MFTVQITPDIKSGDPLSTPAPVVTLINTQIVVQFGHIVPLPEAPVFWRFAILPRIHQITWFSKLMVPPIKLPHWVVRSNRKPPSRDGGLRFERTTQCGSFMGGTINFENQVIWCIRGRIAKRQNTGASGKGTMCPNCTTICVLISVTTGAGVDSGSPDFMSGVICTVNI